MNSHYVPRLTLRHFGDCLCTYNVKTGKYLEGVKLEHAFCENHFYSEEIEKQLNPCKTDRYMEVKNVI